ncbi:MAG TPA: copper oxidase [Bacillales bacterium]|nr:copper oxidase [Bacillales bacterium]
MVKRVMMPLLAVLIIIVGIVLGKSWFGHLSDTTSAREGSSEAKKVQPAEVVSPNIPKAKYKVQNGVKVFHLNAEPVKQEVSDGVFMKGWGYNGSIPGPTIVVNQGDKIRVVVTNHLNAPTSVHWHGLIVPNKMDGVPGVEPSPAIKPGDSFTYEFKVKQAGTFMYHSHVNTAKQEQMGLTGLLVSLPAKPKPKNQVDEDYVVLLQEWQLGMYKEGQVPAGTYKVNPMGMMPNVFTMNGKQFPATAPLDVKKGDKVKIRLGNLSMDTHPIHLHGHNFKVVAKDGVRLPKSDQYKANTVKVAPGETYDIVFTADNPGNWPLHCHIPHHTAGPSKTPGGMFTIVHYQNKPMPKIITNPPKPHHSGGNGMNMNKNKGMDMGNTDMGNQK